MRKKRPSEILYANGMGRPAFQKGLLPYFSAFPRLAWGMHTIYITGIIKIVNTGKSPSPKLVMGQGECRTSTLLPAFLFEAKTEPLIETLV